MPNPRLKRGESNRFIGHTEKTEKTFEKSVFGCAKFLLMNLWKTIHRKLIDEPIERLVGWPQFTSGSLSEKNTSDGPVSENNTESDECRSTEEAQLNRMYWTVFGLDNENSHLWDDDGTSR